MEDIFYTRHAKEKFQLLKQFGFEITPDQIEKTIRNPDKIVPQSNGRFIAQRRIAENHVLRVIYRVENEDFVIITFYPGRRERYED